MNALHGLRRFASSVFLPGRIAAAVFLAGSLVSVAAGAPIATTTQLNVPVSSVGVGRPAQLVATVQEASGTPVLLGTVNFYDGTRLLGSAQIVSGAGGAFAPGTANLKTASFTPGANSVTAVVAGTGADAASTSAARTTSESVETPPMLASPVRLGTGHRSSRIRP